MTFQNQLLLHFGSDEQTCTLTREALDIERDDGTARFQCTLGEVAPPLCGHGRTRREAALHLAHQLSQLAIMIGGSEGTTQPSPTPEQDIANARLMKAKP